MQPQMDEQQLHARYRAMLILWGAFVVTVIIYFTLARVLFKPSGDGLQSREITFALTATGTFLTIISFALKQKFLKQAEDSQAPALVQTGHIIAFALCESAALLGFVDFLVTGNRYYYVMFVIALIGLLLHFPKRDQIAAAAYRQKESNSNNPGGM